MRLGFLVDLKFPETVLEKFDFLTHRYGFVCTRCGKIGVVYESDSVFVGIFYDFRDGGLINLNIGLLSSGTEKGFDLYYVIELSDPEEAKKFRHHRVVIYEKLQQVVLELATLLQQYGDKVLQGDRKAFARLQSLVDRDIAEERAHKQERQEARQRAESARQESEQLWRQGQFGEAHVKAEEALQLAKQGGVSYGIGLAHLTLARSAYGLGKVDDANLNAKRAQRRFAKYRDAPDNLRIKERIEDVIRLLGALNSSPDDPSAYLEELRLLEDDL